MRKQQRLHLKKYLSLTNQTQNLVTEKLKERCRRCNKTFGKKKANAINKVEHIKHGCVIQVTTQRSIEQSIVKDNSHRFLLA